MRRSGSSSCMLRPKNSFSAEDLQRLASEPTSILSTTVLTVNKLPNYCTDRLYMLSELQVHSNSIDFLCDLNNSNTGNSSVGSADNTVSTEEEEDDDNEKEVQVILPPSIILYLLWKPNTYPTPRSFVDGPLSECVKQCLLANGDEVLDNSSYDVSPKTPPYNSGSAPNSPIRRQQLGVGAVNFDKLKRDTLQDEWGNSADISRSRRASIEETSKQKQMTKIYVVVDRISPSETTATDTDAVDDGIGELPDFSIGSSSFDQTDYSTSTANNSSIQPLNHSQSQTSNEQHNTEIKMAEKLAKSVSSNKFLRSSIDGISIGITSDARAAPGLEACMDAVCRGSKERRKAVRDYRLKKKSISSSSSSSGSSREEQALQHLRDKSPERSPVAIVAIQPDDLECTDNDHHSHSHSHHHHSEEEVSPNILQCRVSTEWNGLGEYNTFTDRAMKDWRKAWNVADVNSDVQNGINGSSSGNNTGRAVRPKVPRINRRKEIDNDYDEKYADEPISTVMITVLLVGIVAYVWKLYGNIIMSVLFGDDGILNPTR